MQLTHSPNHSKYLEDCTLGVLFFEPAKAPIVCNLLQPEYFYHDFTKLVFETITKMVADYKPIDLITVTEEICIKLNTRKYNGDNISYLCALLMQDVVSGAHIEEWCSLIIHYYKARNIESITSISASSLPVKEKQEKIAEVLRKSEITTRNNSWVQMGKVLQDYINFYSENFGKDVLGLKFGFPKTDWILSGARPGDLIVLAARPSIGKSAMGSQIAVNLARENKTVGIVTLEMSNEQLMGRIISYATGTHFEDINRMHVPVDHMMRKSLEIEGLPIIFSEESKCSIEGIRAGFQKLVLRKPVDLLIIDYIQLMESEKRTNNRNEEVGKITKGLKEMAKFNSIPIIALAQLNRAAVGKGEPQLENLRESGDIEQDADKVIFIHGDRDMPERLLIVAKNRNGKLGKVPMQYNGNYMKFEETGDAQDYSEPNDITNPF